MTRHVFISYQHTDHMQAHGFNLMRYNPNVGVDFVGRHLLSPVNSNDPHYIERKIKERIKGSSATIVLLGKHTGDSEWVTREIKWSIEQGKGILGIRLSADATVPDELTDCGAEIIDWYKPADVREFDAAIERAIAATNRARNMPLNSISTCSR